MKENGAPQRKMKMKMATLPPRKEGDRWLENNAGHFDILAPRPSSGALLLFIPIL